MAEEMKQKCVEDEVEYRIFPEIPDSLTNTEMISFLEQQLETYLACLSDLLIGYIWQNEPFQLRAIPATDNVAGHLFGSTKFGDNIEDEWFIVYVLKHLTTQVQRLVVQVYDNDGEFLLIEAADDLPGWLNPDTSENRIFLYNGKLQILPNKYDVDNTVEGLKLVRDVGQQTQASNKVQRHIDKRLQGYPDKAKESFHYTTCYIPASLAVVLQHQPHLVAAMIQAFYHRDPVDLKSCVTFQHFRPGTRVMRRVQFTRCLYSQLMKQMFQPDRRSGYTLPATSNPQYKEHDLGTKLAHGAEILCSKCDYNNELPMQHHRWQHFLATLEKNGYFKGELEGSQLYCKLLEEAKNYFTTSTEIQNSKKNSPGEQILHIIKNVPYDVEEMRKEEQYLPPSDDDSWLELTPEQLDNMMKEAYGDTFSGTTDNLDRVPGSIKSFINKVSSHEGAEFPSDDHRDVELDPNSFIHTMQKMFEFKDDASSSSDDMSEYGSDQELDDHLTPSASTHSNLSSNSGARDAPNMADLQVEDYMEIMDQELAKTTIGKSFVKEEEMTEKPIPPPRRKRKDKGEGPTKVPPTGKSENNTPGKIPPGKAPRALSDDIDDLEEDFAPINVDMNLVENLLESYGSQQGMAGPAGNILGRMGVHLPQDSGTTDEHLD